jgi:hypothetical protein
VHFATAAENAALIERDDRIFRLGRGDTKVQNRQQRAVQEARTSKWTHRNLIQALTRMGRLDEAKAAAARLLEIDPSHRVGPLVERNMNPKYNEERRLALLAAGLPE